MTDVGIKGESIVQDDSKTFDNVDLTKINRDNKRVPRSFIATEFELIDCHLSGDIL